MEAVADGSEEFKKLKCDALIEWSYSMQIYKEHIAHKLDNDHDIFYMILNGGKEARIFDLVYLYQKDGKLVVSH